MSELALEMTISRKPDWAFARFLRSLQPPPAMVEGAAAAVPRGSQGRRGSVALAVPAVGSAQVHRKRWSVAGTGLGAGAAGAAGQGAPGARLPSAGRAMNALAIARYGRKGWV